MSENYHPLIINRRILLWGLWTVLGGVIFVAPAQAQSGTRGPTGSQPRASGGGARDAAQTPVGLEGYCPVCIIEMKQWVKGSPQFAVEHDGKTYLFPGEEQRQMFLEKPAKYTPALGGDCVVCYADGGDRVPGSIRHAALSGGRLFLFPNQEFRQAFLREPAKYSRVDVALGGKCSVCRVEMNQDVDGDPGIATTYKGKRYYFPSEDQRRMFLAEPQKYEAK